MIETFVPAPLPPEFKLYVDLDGVLVDFEKKALEVAGFTPLQNGQDKKLRSDFWKAIAVHVRRGKQFFAAMDPMTDAFVLWDYIKHRAPEICSATGHLKGAADEKRMWVRKHLGDETANIAHFVRDARDKAQFAAPTHILIDDRHKAIDPWVEAGGIGILHKDAKRTIAQLKELGL